MKFVSRLDRFAPKVELNLEGSTYQQSSFGGVISIVSYIALLAYGITLFNRLVHRDDPQISTYDLVTDLSKVGNVSAKDINFDLAVSIWSEEQSRTIPFVEAETYFTVEISINTAKDMEYK